MESILSNIYNHQSHWDNTKFIEIICQITHVWFFLCNHGRYSAKKFFLLLIHIHLVVIHIFVSSDKPERLHLRLLILQIKMIVYIERNYIYMMIIFPSQRVYINTKTIFLPLFQTPLDNRIEIHPAYPKEACLFRWCEFSYHDSFFQANEQDW